MGSVWAARNELTNRDFAVKFLRSDLATDSEALQRFFLEARACGQIRHPSIVDVYDMGQADDGSPYLVMEILEGEGFDDRLSRLGMLRAADVCRYVATIARGLDEAHLRGLIHRDIKPGNIYFAIDKSGDVVPKLLDFGISKETRADDFVKTSTGAVLGSPAYMSPEQAGGELDVDARTDIWSLGVIMYEALSGQVPFDAGNYNALMVRILNEPHRPLAEVNPAVPEAVSEIVDRALSKDRNDRFSSAGELADHLERAYGQLTLTPLDRPERRMSMPPLDGSSTQNGWFRVTPKGKRRLNPAVWLGAGLAVLGLGAAGLALAQAAPTSVASVERVGAAVRAAAAHGQSAFSEAEAARKTAKAEAQARKAEQRAEKAEASNAEPKTSRPSRPVRPAKPASTDVHGGVSDPGF